MIYDVQAAIKVPKSLPVIYTCNAQDSHLCKWPTKKCLCSSLNNERMIMIQLEKLNAQVNLVASDIVRHTFN